MDTYVYSYKFMSIYACVYVQTFTEAGIDEISLGFSFDTLVFDSETFLFRHFINGKYHNNHYIVL